MNGRQPIICFDFGGTLVNDPFEEVINTATLRANVASILSKAHLSIAADALIEAWCSSNKSLDFPFASHFAQEEIWIGKALETLGCPARVAAVLRAAILQEYRTALPGALRRQPHLSILRPTLQTIKARDIALYVASNDREFATPAMVQWAGLDGLFERVFTSEGLSQITEGAEKPNALFFMTLLRELNCSAGQMIYVGDSERNDIEPALALGITAVRFFNPGSDPAKSWLGHAATTQARYSYGGPNELKAVLERALADIGRSHTGAPDSSFPSG